MRRLRTESRHSPGGRTVVFFWPYSVCDKSRPTIAWTMRARSKFDFRSVTTWRPSRSTVMRSAMNKASSSACEMKITETPRAFRLSTRSKKYFFSSGVRLAVGSSKMMMRALCSTARAISTICFFAAPSRPTVAVGSTSKLSDCRNCCAEM